MIEYITSNFVEISGVIALIILVGERIARLTPTETDNKIIQWIRKVANVIGVNFPDVR